MYHLQITENAVNGMWQIVNVDQEQKRSQSRTLGNSMVLDSREKLLPLIQTYCFLFKNARSRLFDWPRKNTIVGLIESSPHSHHH